MPAMTAAPPPAAPHRPLVSHVLVAAFHHTLGPIVEWVHPPLPPVAETAATCAAEDAGSTCARVLLPDSWATLLPFCALPDGAHAADECMCAFHLPPVTTTPAWAAFASSTVFASACIRKIASSELVNKTPDITRQHVQKAVVVLSSEPIFGFVQEKLNIVTEAYFMQGDFSNREIIVGLYDSLHNSTLNINDYQFFLGLDLRALISRFRSKTLVLFKLLLLQKNILFYSTSSEVLAKTQYALLSLIPNLFFHLSSSGSTELDYINPKNCSVIMSDTCHSPYNYTTTGKTVLRGELCDAAAMPPVMFGLGSIFQPYVPLQQLYELERANHFFAGTSNALIREKPPATVGAIVLCDIGEVQIIGEGGSLSVGDGRSMLSYADKKWIRDIVSHVSHQQYPNSLSSASSAASLHAGLHLDTTDALSYAGGSPAAKNHNGICASPLKLPLDVTEPQSPDAVDHHGSALATVKSAENAPELDIKANPGTKTPQHHLDDSQSISGSPAVLLSPSLTNASLPPITATDYEDMIRDYFEIYLFSFLATLVAHNERPKGEVHESAEDPNSSSSTLKQLEDYDEAFVQEFCATPFYQQWITKIDSKILDMVDPGHPCEGFDAVKTLNWRLQNTLQGLEEKKTQLQASFASAVTSGSRIMEKVMIRVKEEASKKKENINMQKTAAAAQKAKDMGFHLWSSASGYLATKKAELHQAATDLQKKRASKPISNSPSGTVLYSGPAEEPTESEKAKTEPVYEASSEFTTLGCIEKTAQTQNQIENVINTEKELPHSSLERLEQNHVAKS